MLPGDWGGEEDPSSLEEVHLIHPARQTPGATLWAALELKWNTEVFMGSINIYYEQSIVKEANVFKTHSHTLRLHHRQI